MDLSKIKEFIIQQNLINKIHNNPKEIYPLGSFNSYSNVPLGWNKNLDINDFKDKYTKINNPTESMGKNISFRKDFILFKRYIRL